MAVSFTVGLPTDAETVPGSLVSVISVTFPTITVTDTVPGAVTPALTPTIFQPVGIASEASLIPGALTPASSVSVGIPSDTETVPGALTFLRTVGVGVATENSTAISVAILSKSAGLVTMAMSLTATGHVIEYHADGLITLSMSLASVATYVPSWSGVDTFPVLTGTGDLLGGAVYNAAINLPVPVGDGSANPGADITLPALMLSADMVDGKDVVIAATLPKLVIAATASFPQVYEYAEDLPVLRVSGDLLTGAVLNASLALQPLQLSGALTIPEALTAVLVLPAMQVTGTLLVPSIVNLDETLPALSAAATMSNAVATTVSSLVVNTRHFAHTNYSSFPFTSFAQLNGSVYGAGATGLYRLDGADDAGTAISANFMSGADDYDSARLKAQNVVYLGYESDGAVELLVGVDDDPSFSYTYPVDRDLGSSGVRPARVSIGRGLRSRYWHTGVRNVAGAYFRVYELSHGVSKLKRKS